MVTWCGRFIICWVLFCWARLFSHCCRTISEGLRRLVSLSFSHLFCLFLFTSGLSLFCFILVLHRLLGIWPRIGIFWNLRGCSQTGFFYGYCFTFLGSTQGLQYWRDSSFTMGFSLWRCWLSPWVIVVFFVIPLFQWVVWVGFVSWFFGYEWFLYLI